MKILVLCIDRDDDLGKKAGIKGPIIGKEKNIEAAKNLLLADPAEADGNAIFEAVKIFDETKDAVEVVTLTGHSSRGYKSDKTVASQLEAVLKKYKVDGVYLVTDGADDDQIIPIIQSQTKVISKKTLIIKQAKELEKSYYVLKEVLKDPTFARLIFGLPGLVFLVLAFFQEFGVRIIIFAVGGYLLIKGFGIEDKILDAFRFFRSTTSVDRASFPLYIASFLLILLSFWAGFEKFAGTAEPNVLKQCAIFLNGFLPFFVIGIFLFFLGRIGDMHFQGEPLRLKKYGLSIVTAAATCFVIFKADSLILGEILFDEFVIWVLAAFIGSIAGLALVRRAYIKRYVAARLQKGMSVYDQNGNKIGAIFDFSKKLSQAIVELKDKEKAKVPFSRILLVKDFVTVKTK